MKCSRNWLEALPEGDSLDVLRDLAYSHALEAGIYSERLTAWIHRCQFKELCEFEVDYSLDGLTPYSVRNARQAVAFFSKLRHLNIGVDREETGMSKFLEAELLCRETNQRFRMRRDGSLGFPSRVEAVLHRSRRKIARVLKAVPVLADLTLRFGPGSTRKTRKADASIRRKSSEGVTCSEELFPVIKELLRELPHLSSENATVTRVDEAGDEWDTVLVEIHTSLLCFVFKNALTFRLIGIEPLMNLIYQLGYGIVMAKRLAAFGQDIRDQSVNQRRARIGSLTGALATLDLSSASDTVALELVYDQLPLDWAHVLARGRSGKIELPNGSIVIQEKFSAMGNGYTFPLETLIFWALASSCCSEEDDVSVYGDDIIVPSDRFSDVVEVLRYAGFNVNPKKSFASGPFRESCGHDYFEGIDVRPYYQKEWVSGQSLFVLHNWYVKHGDDDRAKRVARFLDPQLCIYGPDGYGDGYLIGDHQRRRTSAQQRDGFGGYFFESFVTKPRSEDREVLNSGRGDLPAALYTIYRAGSLDGSLEREFRVGEAESHKDETFADVIERELGSPVTPVSVDRKGRKRWGLPGANGYKKIKIYTLGT